MTARNPVVETYSFRGENAASAAASALRKIQPLAKSLPAGRLFEAISSLADKSASAALEYEKAAIAMLRNEIAEAEINLKKANRVADEINDAFGDQVAIPLPNFFKKRR
jgi:hypothetical protein